METTPEFDIILWGATGFTGQLVAHYLAKRLQDTPLRWAVAGRNPNKLQELQRLLPGQPPILLANSQDPESLAALVAQGRVIVSTVGPYAQYGAALVAACVTAGRAYCDLTGETPWVRQMIDAHHSAAAATGARIVHCCGYDSIPSDLGVLMMQEYAWAQYGRAIPTIHHIVGPAKGGLSGGTIASMLNMMEMGGEMTRQLADPFLLAPELAGQTAPRDQTGPRYNEASELWTAPFIMAAINSRVVYRSNSLLAWRYGRDFQYHESLRTGHGLSGRLKASGVSAGMAAGMISLQLKPLRRLLQATILPQPGDGPSVETQENGFFRSKLIGLLPATADQPAAVIRGRVAGQGDPGYKGTAQMLGETAVALAEDERPHPPVGVLTPAAALGMELVERLRRSGMTFAIDEA
jgi:short subunit dehydrogenase-like uncharacterized protein